MVISDFIDFDEHEYANRISQYDTERLFKQEVRKVRQQVSAGTSAGLGLVTAVFTAGLSLVTSAIGVRRLYVAAVKLELIKKELTRRGFPLYDTRMRDVLIPVTTSLLTLGVGTGLEQFALDATSIGTTGTSFSSGSSSRMLSQPAGDTFDSFTTGFREQLQEIGGVFSQHDAATQALITQDTVTQSPGGQPAAGASGYHLGMLVAQHAETKGAAEAAGAVNQWMLESLMGHTKARFKSACIRALGTSGGIACDQCRQEIKGGGFWRRS